MIDCDRKSFFLCVLSVILSITVGCVSDQYPGYFRSDFSYGLTIYTDEPITNVTFYVPLPVKNGQPMVGKRVLNESDFARENFTISFTQSPPGLNLTGSYPVPGNNPWYVKLSAQQILPGPETGPAPGSAFNIDIIDNRDLPSPLLFPNTLSPVGNESVFLPKLDFTPLLPTRKQQSRTLELLEYDNLMIPEKTPIYIEYFASPSAEVHGGSSIQGSNEWKDQDDVWISNSYSDHYSWSHTGESHGWQIASGMLYEGGQGIYPNLTHPLWQKAIQRA